MGTDPINDQPQQQPYGFQPAPSSPVVSLQDWLITILLLAIPLVNIILLFIWAFGNDTNPSKANYAKASLIWIGIVLVCYVLFFVIFLGAMVSSHT
ncbi:hypothetical protein [Paenibacillus sp. N3.4]|uniref:hypothetical protein n=1 Tax=Paenibacillus sp. N3.4 TaxID=2603222 RepID=UPI0028FCF4D3|nr:hypothetical protein [Paenibacillus sp. N3.4]